MGSLTLAYPSIAGKTTQEQLESMRRYLCSVTEQLNLAEHKVYGYGQNYGDDDFEDVLARIEAADTLVVGSPVYWHNLSGMLRNLLDRFYGPVREGSMSGKTLYFVFQGGAPTREMLDWGEYTMKRFAALYGMTYGGMATNKNEATKLGKNI